jgi:hypothetical protein
VVRSIGNNIVWSAIVVLVVQGAGAVEAAEKHEWLPGRPIGIESPVPQRLVRHQPAESKEVAGHPRKFFVLASVRMAAAIFDAWTTQRVIDRHPNGRELNPVIRPFSKHPASLYGVMAGFAALQIWIADQRMHRGDDWQLGPVLGATVNGVSGGLNLRF